MSAALQLWTLDRRGAPEFVGPMPDLPTARRCWRALSQAVVIGSGGRVVDERGDVPRADLERVRAAARARSTDAAPAALAPEVVAAPATPATTAREEAAVAELMDAPGRPETSTDVPPPVAVPDEAPVDVQPEDTTDDVVGGAALEASARRRTTAPHPQNPAPSEVPVRADLELDEGAEVPETQGATCPVKGCEEPPAGTWSPGHPRRCDELLVKFCRRHRVNAGVRHRNSGGSLASIVQTMIEAGDSARFVRPPVPVLRRPSAPEEDPLAELRAVGARLAAHRELLDAADALTPADRAMVVALARRLAERRAR